MRYQTLQPSCRRVPTATRGPRPLGRRRHGSKKQLEPTGGTVHRVFAVACVQVPGAGGEAELPPEELRPARPNRGAPQAEGQGLCSGTTVAVLQWSWWNCWNPNRSLTCLTSAGERLRGPESPGHVPPGGTQREAELPGQERAGASGPGGEVRAAPRTFGTAAPSTFGTANGSALPVRSGWAARPSRCRWRSASWSSRGSSITWPWTSCCCRSRAWSRRCRGRDTWSRRRGGLAGTRTGNTRGAASLAGPSSSVLKVQGEGDAVMSSLARPLLSCQ